MLDYKIALALNAETVEKLKKGEDKDIILEREQKGMIRTVCTPDGDYKILLWDWEPDMRLDDRYTHLLQSIENIRHALVEINDEGDIFYNVEQEDEDGIDGVFEDILGYRTQITLWGDPDNVIL